MMLTKPANRAIRQPLPTVRRLVEFFGYKIPRHRRKNSFFAEHAGELEWIYHDCRKVYLDLAKKAHPDNGGGHEASVAINTAWDRLTHLFSLHCSSIKSPTFIKRETPQLPRKPKPIPVKRPRATFVFTPARRAHLERITHMPHRVIMTPKRIAAAKANVRKMLASRGIVPKADRQPLTPAHFP